MTIEQNIARFEAEVGRIDRPGIDKLMDYVRKSDFYKAPASTKYHLSVPGGLLQHSLNVLDALRGILTHSSSEDETRWDYEVAGRTVASISDESLTIIALFHDICKTYFYKEGFRWYKDDQNKWQQAPTFEIDDKMPLGHGDKSAMIIKQYMELTSPEMYAIWWHMGITDGGDIRQFGQAIDKYPIIYALHTADMMASHFMEANDGNAGAFVDQNAAESAGEYADAPTTDTEDAASVFEEAPPVMSEA